jgi:hypothetical protein
MFVLLYKYMQRETFRQAFWIVVKKRNYSGSQATGKG